MIIVVVLENYRKSFEMLERYIRSCCFLRVVVEVDRVDCVVFLFVNQRVYQRAQCFEGLFLVDFLTDAVHFASVCGRVIANEVYSACIAVMSSGFNAFGHARNFTQNWVSFMLMLVNFDDDHGVSSIKHHVMRRVGWLAFASFEISTFDGAIMRNERSADKRKTIFLKCLGNFVIFPLLRLYASVRMIPVIVLL